MSDLVPYKKPPVRRVSRARLRKWLLEQGPQRLAKIRQQAKADVPDVKLAEVRSILEGNPEFFSLVEDDVWAAIPEAKESVIRVYRSRPRPRPVPEKKRAKPSTPRRKTAPARRKASPVADVSLAHPMSVERGAIHSVIFRRGVPGGEPYESGRYLMLVLPQEGAAGVAVLESTLALARATSECLVFEALPLGSTVFRGTRRLIHASIDECQSKVRIVFDSADDDEARHRSLQLSSGIRRYLALSSGSGTSLVHADPKAVAEAERVPADLQKVLTLPPPVRGPSAAECAKQVQARLAALDADSSKWEQYRNWLIERRPLWTRPALEDALKVTFAKAEGVAPALIAGLAVLVLGNEPVSNPALALRACIVCGNAHDKEACAWAKESCLPLALEHYPEDGELHIAGANIAITEGREADAARFFARAVNAGQDLSRDELGHFLLAAIFSGQRKAGQVALRIVQQKIIDSADPDNALRNTENLKYAVDLSRMLGEDAFDLCTLVIKLLVVQDEPAALEQARLYLTEAYEFNVDQKFLLLSLLESCESVAVITGLIDALEQLINRNFDRVKPDVMKRYIQQLRLVETALGWNHELSDHYLGSLPAEARQTRIDPRPLNNRRVTVVGGRRIARSRARQLLLELGALDVREIPPSFEERLDKKTVSQRTQNADVIAMFTDYVKHDVQDILRELGRSFISVNGGPSRLVRRVLESA